MTFSFARHQVPPAIIRHAVWLYVRFTLSYRDVEDLLAERGLDACADISAATCLAPAAGRRPQRHVVNTLRNCTGAGARGETQPRHRAVLHLRHRIGRISTDRLWRDR